MTEKHGYVGQKKRFRLRGWKKLPYALDDKISGGVAFVMPDMFRTLKFCNGRFKDDNPMFGNEGWKHLEILIDMARGIKLLGVKYLNFTACLFFRSGYYDRVKSIIN